MLLRSLCGGYDARLACIPKSWDAGEAFVCASAFFVCAHRRPVACAELLLGRRAGWE